MCTVPCAFVCLQQYDRVLKPIAKGLLFREGLYAETRRQQPALSSTVQLQSTVGTYSAHPLHYFCVSRAIPRTANTTTNTISTRLKNFVEIPGPMGASSFQLADNPSKTSGHLFLAVYLHCNISHILSATSGLNFYGIFFVPFFHLCISMRIPRWKQNEV